MAAAAATKPSISDTRHVIFEKICLRFKDTKIFRFGSWAAVRHNALMLQHCLNKQTLCSAAGGLLSANSGRSEAGATEKWVPTFAMESSVGPDLDRTAKLRTLAAGSLSPCRRW